MIKAIGIDMADIKRFDQWRQIAPQQLKKIFSEAEIAYCLQEPLLSAQRFAVRIAAREAFFKALCTANPDHAIPFLRVCRAVRVVKNARGTPKLHVDWQSLESTDQLVVHLSLTHTLTVATAIITLEAR